VLPKLHGCFGRGNHGGQSQIMCSPNRRRERSLPLTEAVFALVSAELGLLPGLAAVVGEIDARDARITAEGDPAGEHRGAGRQLVACPERRHRSLALPPRIQRSKEHLNVLLESARHADIMRH